LRNRFLAWMTNLNQTSYPQLHQPDRMLERIDQVEALKDGIEKLPLRQQQAFLLRSWEGFDVRQTAKAMSCSEGTVKTHYSRAVHTLRTELEQLK
jgi:RNA polymerase sigma-70 factor (ECF subfamily)